MIKKWGGIETIYEGPNFRKEVSAKVELACRRIEKRLRRTVKITRLK